MDNMKKNLSLKSIGETVLKISCSQAYITSNYIYLKSSMAAILVLVNGPKSIAFVF